jgi:hypothetical protein
MNRKKVGIAVFGLGVFGLLANFIALWISSPIRRVSTVEEMAGTIWEIGSPVVSLLGLFTIIGIGALVMGALIYSGKKGSRFWLWGFVPIIVFGMLAFWEIKSYIPAIYGIGGGIITIAYMAVIWFWIKNHDNYEGTAKTGKHIELLGYSFLYITSLFLCLLIGQPNLPGLADQPVVSSYSILATFSISWILLAIGSHLSGQGQKN